MEFTQPQKEAIKSSLTSFSDHELEEMYCENLDEQGPVKIAGYDYEVSHALKNVDPVAYRCGLADYMDYLLEEQFHEIDGEYFRQYDVEELIESLLESEVSSEK